MKGTLCKTGQNLPSGGFQSVPSSEVAHREGCDSKPCKGRIKEENSDADKPRPYADPPDKKELHLKKEIYKCVECDYGSGWLSELVKHVEIHIKKSDCTSDGLGKSCDVHKSDHDVFHCSECNFCGKSWDDLKNHESTHIERKPYVCAHCDHCFDALPKIRKHIARIHVGSLSKGWRNQSSRFEGKTLFQASKPSNASSERKNRAKKGAGPFKCAYCDYSTAKSREIAKHAQLHLEKTPFQCSSCDYRAAKASHLGVHMRMHSGRTVFHCSKCSFCTKSQRTFREHQLGHTAEKDYRCAHCDSRFATLSEIRRHISQSHNRSLSNRAESKVSKSAGPMRQCQQCDFKAYRLSCILWHMRSHYRDMPYRSSKANPKSDKFECPDCNFSSSQSSQLCRHGQIHGTEMRFQCPDCDYKSHQRCYLDSHKLGHCGRKIFQCSECSFCSVSEHQLERHGHAHCGLRPYICAHCGSRSPTLSKLRTHIVATHLGEKLYKCTLCDFSTAHAHNLKKHKFVHSGKKPFQCNVCGFSTAHLNNFKRHVGIYGQKGPKIKIYECNRCDYSSNYLRELQYHMQVHSEKKPFQCRECIYSFSTSAALKAHEMTHTGEKRHKCALCNYRTAYSPYLVSHMLKHSGEKPFKCQSCRYSTVYKRDLARHEKTCKSSR
ncbi:Hypothetical protein NTJ_11931 [Nesidiocoris tenuis]|uniref:C2H2-type domain-containing protein n=1 Tax=Nesidiocoris tenuis TaxID=355587 RepID=A0ABN7B3Y9_9HEMI|nr:Hypothetical protein NTJ_11931 [Nesidiocoris tenuis]